MIGDRLLAVTFGTWKLRTRPPRSTRETTGCFGGYRPERPVRGLSAHIGLISFDSGPFSPKRAGLAPAGFFHRFPDAVGHEPCRLILYVHGPHHLVAAEPLLAAANQIDALQPLMHRNVAVLEYGSDRGGKLLAAGIALQRAGFRALTVQPTNAVGISAMDANRAVGPDDAFQFRDRSGFIVEEGGRENGHGKHLSMEPI